MKRLIYFVTACILIMIGGCTEEPTVTTGSVSGLVLDASNGTEPLVGVTVSIPVLGESATTGSTGSFTFSDVESGTYILSFTKTGYITEQKNVSVVAGKSSSVSVQMKPTEKKAEIEFNPSSLNFGTNQTDLSVTIKNNGNATAEWSLNLGNNNWLSVSEMAGSIQSGRTQSIVFTVDRNYLSEPKSVVINLHAFGNSYPLTISCAPNNAKSEMTIDLKSLDFGSIETEKSLTIRNTGKATLTWTASGITENAITLSQESGTIAAGGNSVIKVLLDRSKFEGTLTTSFTINDGVKSEVISVSANTSGSGGGETPGTDELPSGLVETKGLYAYFPFNNDFKDYGENSINSYCNPEPSFVKGISTDIKALSFSRAEGSTFYVNEGLIDTPSMSVCFWLKDINEGNIFWVETSGGHRQMFLGYREGHLKYVMSRSNNQYETSYDFSSTGNYTHKAIDDGEWHHIALVSDFNSKNKDCITTSLYIDGILMDTLTEYYAASNETSQTYRHFGVGKKFTIGGSNTPNMKIANLRVYDTRKLNEEQIKNIYNAKQ